MNHDDMKYILVAGGVISGIGKGVLASSLGTLLKSCNLRVTSIKIDPYINIDAGTFSPYEHGEVFVLADGGEVDLDLGNYERFLDITLQKDNNITTGKVYQNVMTKERRGDYMGKTVQVVPHVTREIREWVERVAQLPVDGSGLTPQVCIIELGGTIGDMESMPYVEAFRELQRKVKNNLCCMFVSMVLADSTGEHKTKPTQNGIKQLRNEGLLADFIICRSKDPINLKVQTKISNFCSVDLEKVICLPDVGTIYKVPIILQEQGIHKLLNSHLSLGLDDDAEEGSIMVKWKRLVLRQEQLTRTVAIALVGKYTEQIDAYKSVNKALMHAALKCNRRLDIVYIESSDLEEKTKEQEPGKYHTAWSKLTECNGILVPGGFDNRGFEGKVSVCQYARTKNIPFLGVCLGMQAAVVEFSRNILQLSDATSEEIDETSKNQVVIKMLEHHPGTMGGTMRLGVKKTVFKTEGSKIRKLYSNRESVEERHRHRYEVNPVYVGRLEEKGLQFVGHDEAKERMEILELDGHPYYVACQYHPEYLTRPLLPSPPYHGLLLAATGKLAQYLSDDGEREDGLPSRD